MFDIVVLCRFCPSYSSVISPGRMDSIVCLQLVMLIHLTDRCQNNSLLTFLIDWTSLSLSLL